MKLSLLTLLCTIVLISVASAQDAKPTSAPSAAPTVTPNPVTAALRLLLPRSQSNILGAIEAMPADKFSYKPTPEQITFGHLVVHIADSNNRACSWVSGMAAPKVDELKDTDAKDKLLAATKASFEFCSGALAKLDDSKLGENVEMFGGRTLPRSMAAFALASGWADHYGMAAIYLRLNGIVPPTAQPKK
jgi:uncharacterized damage-inducible protein DinB